MDRDTADHEDGDGDGEQEGGASNDGPRTPKRMRVAPEILPLGLECSDFHDLRAQAMEQAGEARPESVEGKELREEWTTEEDRLLVELVLEKLKLTKSDWQDCARSLGRDRGSVGKRWKSLMAADKVGLKSRPRRGEIHQTWR